MNTKLIKSKILSGDIKSWTDVYGYTTPAEMAETLGRDKRHWEYVKDNPGKMHLEDVFNFCEAVGISKGKFMELVGVVAD